MKRPYPYTKNENVMMAYLREGNEDQRVQALCDITKKNNFDLFWEIFLSDENKIVKMNALNICISYYPDKILHMLETLMKEHDEKWYHPHDEYIDTLGREFLYMYKEKRFEVKFKGD